MTRQRSITHFGLEFGQDPLDDPLVVGWDAVVGPDPTAQPGRDSDDVVLLRRFHALATVPPPSPGFLADLERQLAAPTPAPPATRKGVGASKLTSFRSTRQDRTGPRSILQPHRWTSMQGAAAVLSVMLVVSLLVLYQAVPGQSEPLPIPAAIIAKPSIVPITQFEFVPPMWGMSDATAWTHIEIGEFSVAPATSFTTDLPFYTGVDGPLSLTVLSGELIVTPAGPAFLYPAHQSEQPPVEVLAGQSVSIGPNDTIVYYAMDTAIGSNPGIEPALILYSLVGAIWDHSLPGATVPPTDVSFSTFEYDDPIPAVPTEGAALTLQRLELAPFDTFVFEPNADLRYLPFIDPNQTRGLHIAAGAFGGLVPESGSRDLYNAVQLRDLKPGPHTIFNLGDKTVSIYFLVVEPALVAGPPTS
jgi:hypothetical protein